MRFFIGQIPAELLLINRLDLTQGLEARRVKRSSALRPVYTMINMAKGRPIECRAEKIDAVLLPPITMNVLAECAILRDQEALHALLCKIQRGQQKAHGNLFARWSSVHRPPGTGDATEWIDRALQQLAHIERNHEPDLLPPIRPHRLAHHL